MYHDEFSPERQPQFLCVKHVEESERFFAARSEVSGFDLPRSDPSEALQQGSPRPPFPSQFSPSPSRKARRPGRLQPWRAIGDEVRPTRRRQESANRTWSDEPLRHLPRAASETPRREKPHSSTAVPRSASPPRRKRRRPRPRQASFRRYLRNARCHQPEVRIRIQPRAWWRTSSPPVNHASPAVPALPLVLVPAPHAAGHGETSRSPP